MLGNRSRNDSFGWSEWLEEKRLRWSISATWKIFTSACLNPFRMELTRWYDGFYRTIRRENDRNKPVMPIKIVFELTNRLNVLGGREIWFIAYFLFLRMTWEWESSSKQSFLSIEIVEQRDIQSNATKLTILIDWANQHRQ